MPGLDEWIDTETRTATTRMLGAISATHLLMERPGFGQRIVPRPGSVLASPVAAHYDPDPDYFFHWFRDSAIVIDALRVALGAGYADRSAILRLREFLQFSRSLQALDGNEFLRQHDFRAQVQPAFLQYLRSNEEIAALTGEALLADVRVNADGTPDFIRWSRPQTDGPALRCLALLRWCRQFPDLEQDLSLRAALSEVIGTDLAFTLHHIHRPHTDVWEEQSGYHYHTQLVQAEALSCGADWLEEGGHREHVRRYRAAAAEALARIDGFWDESAGFYRSRAATEPGEPLRQLDIAVILGVLHAGRRSGAHSVLDPRVQATLSALEQLFEAEYSINRVRPAARGPAMGRYAGDRYYSGGAWYLATLGAAQFCFDFAQALRAAPSEAPARGGEMARVAIERGDAFMRTVQAFTPENGDLSEQFDQTTGVQTSAKHLSWSYAAFITAAASRAQACRPMQGADPATQRAGTD
jgi:glucoamylase